MLPTLAQLGNPCALKEWFEVAALGFGALFLLGKVLGGQFNSGMEVRLSAERQQVDTKRDAVSLTVHLTRTDVGRLEVRQVQIETSTIEMHREPACPGPPALVAIDRSTFHPRERRVWRGKLTHAPSTHGVALPPGDATQLGYLLAVEPSKSLYVDVTILGVRTGPARLLGRPQWRASLVVLPTRAA